MTIIVRRSRLAFWMGIGFLALAFIVLTLPKWPLFFSVWFGVAGVVGLFLGRRTKIVVSAPPISSPALGPVAEPRPRAAIILRPAKLSVRLRYATTPIRYFKVVMVERPADDAPMRELHSMSAQVDAGVRQGKVFDTAEARAGFQDRLTMLGMEFRGGGRVVASPSTHAGSRRIAVMLAWRLDCPLLDLADSRVQVQGPESLRVPYFDRLAAWGPRTAPGPEPAGLRFDASPERLRFTFPQATWLFLVLLLVAAGGVFLMLRGSEILGPTMACMGGIFFLISLAAAPGAVLEIDRSVIRFRWRLPWCKTKIIPLDNVDVLRVLGNEFAILATSGHVQMSVADAVWLRDRIESFVLGGKHS